MKAVRVNLFGGSSTKQRPDSEPRSLGDHGSVFRFLGSQLEGKILRGPMCIKGYKIGQYLPEPDENSES